MTASTRKANILDDLIQGFKSDFDTSRRGRHAAYETLGKSQGRSVAQNVGGFAGRVASDVVGDETRNTMWRYNHPLGVSSFGGSNALKVTGMPVGYQALGGAALALGVMPVASGNFDIGNLGEFGRPKGYQALFADPTDKTKTTNPLGEFAGRYFLGRKGNILPYEELVKERPDVSPDQYAAAVQSGGFMAKDFFGLQHNPAQAIGLGTGLGAVLGAYQRRGSYSKESKLAPFTLDPKPQKVAIGVQPRIVTKPENINTDSGRYWVDMPVRVERGTPESLVAGGLKGAVLGGLVGSLVPAATNLGAIKTQKSLSGEDAISLLGYEVPMSAALATLGAGVGLNYWARKRFKPTEKAMADINAVKSAAYNQEKHKDMGVRFSSVNGRNAWDYIGNDTQLDLNLGI